jgi:6-pyruvoyltetrahydropterin/6-carboxytetrahydropterin synthase
MTFTLTRSFRFEAAHTLQRDIAAEGSRRIHGHSFRAEVSLRGTPDPRTQMIMDMGFFEQALESVRDALDHRLLDEVEGLGASTLENLCVFIWKHLQADLPLLHRVCVYRDSLGESCCYEGSQ